MLSLDETAVCFPCNAQIEEQRPWLSEHQSSLGVDHHWSHTLVSLPARFEPEPPAISVLEQRLDRLDAALEDRLTRVEAKLDERATEHAAFAGDMNVRMARLEALLTQLVGAHAITS
jgi:hypothetical protein